VAVPLPQFADYLRLGTAQIRRYGAGEPALARSLIELLNDVGGSTLDPDRRAAVARHLWLVLQDAERRTSQPADVELVRADAAAALDALGIQPPTTTTIGVDQ
jgi:uncharacterized membrane protein